MAQKLKFGNGNWATKKGSTLAYNDENNNFKPLPFNVERDSIATRVNKEGLIEVVGKDKLRIDYTDNAKGVALLEPSGTNLFLYSQSLESGWLASGTDAPTLTAYQFTSLDGSQNASRLQFPITGTISILQQLFSHTSGQQYTISAYVKSNSSLNQQFKLFGDYGSSSGISSVLTATNEWQRFTFTYTATGTGNRSGGFYYVPNTASDLQIYGIQVEQGSYATSYIPTSGLTVTRQADVANGCGNSEVFNDSEGVLFADISALADDGIPKVISINDNTYSNNRLMLMVSNGVIGRISARFDSLGSDVTLNANGYDLTLNHKVLLKYKANDIAIWVDGFEVNTNASFSIPSGLQRIDFYNPFGGGQDNLYGNTKQIQYYDSVLTDLELETLTSYRSLSELVTELNLNTL